MYFHNDVVYIVHVTVSLSSDIQTGVAGEVLTAQPTKAQGSQRHKKSSQWREKLCSVGTPSPRFNWANHQTTYCDIVGQG